MFNNFWSNNTVKWFWFLVSEFLHCCTLVLYSVSHHWIMWCMSQCCVNITCRSINSCYFCSKSCERLLRIKNIKILNIYNFSAQWVEHRLQSRRYGSIPRAAPILRVLKYEKWRYFLLTPCKHNSLVQPHFDYCNVVWGNFKIVQLAFYCLRATIVIGIMCWGH